uniref:Uncharacterized protein n=1 Tax=Panagrolaimus sp. PS1159 TaxID=55785 RepID=A0AC35EVN6_9BILA
MSLSKYEAKRIGKKVKLAKSPPISEFPADVLKYMKENATPKQIIKSMNVIKYFLPKKCPFTYFGNENFNEYAFLNENTLLVCTPQHIECKLNDIPNNLGISGKLSVWDGRALPKLISKIIVCDIKCLHLYAPRISYSAFKFLTASGKLKELELKKTIVTLKNGFVVPYEILLENTPNLRKKPNLDIRLYFEYSVNTRQNINLYMDKVISAGLAKSFPPHFEFRLMFISPQFDVRRKAYENVRKAYCQRHINLIN